MRNTGKICQILSISMGGLHFVLISVLTAAQSGACSHKYEYVGEEEVTTVRESLALFDSEMR